MNVTGLDGRTYPWRLAGHIPLGDDSRPRSGLHLRARLLLAKLFPADARLEEVPLPGTGGLSGDFYLPARRVMVEVQGQQHTEFTPHFHETRLDFIGGQRRDRRKVSWCEQNGITLVEFPFDERDDQWAGRILGR